MALQVEHAGDVVVLEPEGMLKGGKETDELRNTLNGLVDAGQRKILLDLGKTVHMTSIAIGVVAAIHTSAASHDLCFCVANVNERIRKVWAGVLGLLNPPLRVYATRADALRHLADL